MSKLLTVSVENAVGLIAVFLAVFTAAAQQSDIRTSIGICSVIVGVGSAIFHITIRSRKLTDHGVIDFTLIVLPGIWLINGGFGARSVTLVIMYYASLALGIKWVLLHSCWYFRRLLAK